MELVTNLARALDILEVLLLGFICLVFVVFLRWISRFPSELDRIGADISLYACGSAFSLFAAAFLEGGVIGGASKEDALFLGTSGILLSVMSYFASLYFSEALRKNATLRLPYGIDDWGQLSSILNDKDGATHFKLALALGLLPGIFFFLLDILRSIAH
jgi:hypothetical protein